MTILRLPLALLLPVLSPLQAAAAPVRARIVEAPGAPFAAAFPALLPAGLPALSAPSLGELPSLSAVSELPLAAPQAAPALGALPASLAPAEAAPALEGPALALDARTSAPQAPAAAVGRDFTRTADAPSDQASRSASPREALGALGGSLARPESAPAPLLGKFFDLSHGASGSAAAPEPGGAPTDARAELSRLGLQAPPAEALEGLRRERMHAFLEARSIAVVGASPVAGKVGNAVLANLQATAPGAALYPINPRVADAGTPEMGLRWRRSLLEIPPVDLVVIVVPADQVRTVMEDALRGGHRAVIVISAGLAETGRAQEERALMALAAAAGVPAIGMNSLGVALSGQNASFGATPLPGSIAFLSQSGAMITGGEDLMRMSGMGFRAVFSLGNKTNVDEADLLRLLGEDPHTSAIVGYLEDVKDGRKFLDAARAVTPRKPVVLLRSGRTSLGEAASAAHTAAIGGGTYGAFQAACDEAGVILVDSTRDLFERLKALELGEPVTPPEARPRAPAAAPALAGHPAVDVVGDARADRYENALRVLSEAPEVEAMIMIVSPQTMTEVDATARAALEASRRSGKPVVPVFFGGRRMAGALEAFHRAGLRAFLYPEDAVDHLKLLGRDKRIGVITNAGGLGVQITDYATERGVALARYSEETVRRLEAFLPPASNVHSFYRPRAPRPPGPEPVTLSEAESAARLERAGIPYPRRALGQDLAQLVLLARAMDFGSGRGIVLKAMSPDIDHAVKVGGIAMKNGKVWFLKNEAQLREAFAAMSAALARNVPTARIEGYQLSQVVQGHEVILGAQRDPVYGVVLTLGAGGSKVEELDDAVKAVLSESMTDLEKLDALRRRFSKLKIAAELARAGVDADVILRAALRLYAFVRDNPEVRHVDVNPVKVHPGPSGTELVAVDAWVQLEPQAP